MLVSNFKGLKFVNETSAISSILFSNVLPNITLLGLFLELLTSINNDALFLSIKNSKEDGSLNGLISCFLVNRLDVVLFKVD